jgi:catechol-2,3-dioxygenase
MADIAGFHHASLTVRDRDRSAAWYTSVLGFEELFREDAPERRACVMRFPAGGYSLGLVEHIPALDDPFDPRRRGLDHLAFSVTTDAVLAEWATDLAGAGVDHSGVVEIPTGAILNFKDPDGIALALFWDRASAAAPWLTDRWDRADEGLSQ